MKDEKPATGMGRLIRAQRAARGMSQRDLARAAGLSVGALRDLEQGRTGAPRWGTVEALAEALGIDERARMVHVDRRAATPDSAVRHGGSAAQVRVDVLGPLTAARDGVLTELGPVRQRAVLGLLALHYRSCVPMEAIIDVLWGERSPASAVTEVQGYVSRLRRLLGAGFRGSRGPIATAGSGYRLESTCAQLDVQAFDQRVRRAGDLAGSGEAARACQVYEQALGLWRGEVLADVALMRENPAAAELARRRADAVLGYAESAERAGAHARALTHLRQLCARERFHEQAHARLMIALAATGQQAAALDVFAEMRRRLDADLGIRPGPHLMLAQSRVLRQQLGKRVTIG